MRIGIEALGRESAETARDRAATANRLLRELYPFRREVALAALLIPISAGSQASGFWLTSLAIDNYVLHGDGLGLTRMAVLLLFVYVAGTLAMRVQIRLAGVIGQHVLASMRARLFDKFQRLPLSYFDRNPIGDLISRVINDVDTLNQLFLQGLGQLLNSCFSLIAILIAMATFNLRLTLASSVIIPFMLLTGLYLSKRARHALQATRKTTSDITAGLQEEIAGLREAQAYNRAHENIARFRQRNSANLKANLQAATITSTFAPAVDVFSTLAMAIVIGYGSYLVSKGSLSVGLLAAFLIYAQQLFRPVHLFSLVYGQVQSALAGAERIYAILDEQPEPPDRAGATDMEVTAGQVEFNHVCFAYDHDRTVLHDVSFVMEPGKMVAVVGRTGAGKTTMANLIARFYDVTAGAVLIDGQDVRNVTRRSLRKQMAIVPQEPFLFVGTIADNIGLALPGASQAEIEATARTVGAHDFITNLPGGYFALLGSGGVTLSRGQLQLISLARALLANSRILILDEATSNLDPGTEAVMRNALARIAVGRSLLVIAHRLSTIIDADLILVIDRGRVVEAGVHEELLMADGLYTELYYQYISEGEAFARRA